MVATAVDIRHESNFSAEQEVEVTGGADGIVRVNIDGVCALRIRLKQGCNLKISVDNLYRSVGRVKT